MLHIRQTAYGVKQPNVSQKQRVLQTGDGKSMVNNGGPSGQQMHWLHFNSVYYDSAGHNLSISGWTLLTQLMFFFSPSFKLSPNRVHY